jgi:hypothetical protein
MKIKKPTFDDEHMPPSLKQLPRFGITSKSSSSRSDNEREDVAFGIRSLRDLDKEISRGFTDPDRPKPSPRPTRK